MTRKQVANALGKSLATVRRIEGSLLHPRRDARGVWRFNPKKVAELARKVKSGKSLTVNFTPGVPQLLPPLGKRQQAAHACLVKAAHELRLAITLLKLSGAPASRRKG